MEFKNGNLLYIPDKSKELDIWQNKDYSFGLGVPNLTEAQNQVKYYTDYANNSFKNEKETTYLNEKKDKLWVWKNLGFIFSIGVVFEEDDQKIMSEIIKYFDNSSSSFIPCQHQVLNYNDDFIKIVEKKFGIHNGNYHYILIPFVLTEDETELKQAPEHRYSYFGPVNVFQTPNDIVNYIIEVNNFYGAVKSELTPSVGNYLGISSYSNETNRKIYGDHGSVRTMNPTSFNWQLHGDNPRRIQRKGYIDLDSSDFYELINPQQGYERVAPNKNWGEDSELLDQNTTYRRPMKAYHRENPGVNIGWLNKEGYSQNQSSHRKNGKKSLYNQINNAREGFGLSEGKISDVKGVHLKMNDYYETNENRIEKPNYVIYESTESELNGPDKFIDSVVQREQMPVGWGNKVNFNVPEQNTSKFQQDVETIIGKNKIKIPGLN